MKTKQMDFLKRLASFVLAFIMIFSASPIVLQAYTYEGDYATQDDGDMMHT